MATKNVAIRLGTEGKAEVQNDLRETAQVGKDAFSGIAQATDQAGDAADRMTARYAKMAQAAQAAANAQAAQAKFNAVLGVGGDTKSARDSADAIRQALDLQDQQAAKAAALRAQIDPLYAAQDKLNKAMEEANVLAAAGMISETEHAAAVGLAQKAFKDTEDAVKKFGAAHALSSTQTMMLQSAVFRTGESLAAGMPIWRIAVQQGGEVGAALGMGQGGAGAAISALRATISPTVLVLGGLAAALGAVTIAALGHEEAERKLSVAASGLGRTAGLTGAQLDALAQVSARSGQISISNARDLTAAYVDTGKIGGDVLSGLVSVTRDYATITGTDLKTAGTALATAFSDPSRGADELAARLHDLDAATLDQIRSMQASGDIAGAQRVLLDRLRDSTKGAADHAELYAGSLTRLKNAALDALDALGGLAEKTASGAMWLVDPYGEYMRLQKQHQTRDADAWSALQAAGQGFVNDSSRGAASQARSLFGFGERDNLQSSLDLALQGRAGGPSHMTAEAWAANEKSINAYTRALDSWMPTEERAQKLLEADAAMAAAKTPAEKAAAAATRERLELSGKVVTSASAEAQVMAASAKARASASKSGENHAAVLAREAAAMEQNIKGAWDLAAAYAQSGSAALVAEARRKALTDATKKGADLDAAVAQQIRLAIADQAVAGAKNLDNLKAQVIAQASANDAVASGAATSQQAAQQMQDDLALRQQTVAMIAAEGDQRQKLFGLIMGERNALAQLHAEQARSQVITATQSATDNIGLLGLQAGLVGANPQDRAIALARAQALQDLKQRAISSNSPAGRNYLDSKVGEAQASATLGQAQYLHDTVQDQQQQMALGQAQLAMIGQTQLAQDRYLTSLQVAQELKLRGVDAASDEGKAILANADALVTLRARLELANASWGEIRQTGEQVIDDLGQFLSVDKWGDWRDAGLSALKDIAAEFEKLALLNPIKNALFGESLPTLSSTAGLLGGLLGFADGTDGAPGGWSWVGERGKELMYVPQGSRVVPHAQSMAMAASSTGGLVQHIDASVYAPGADSAKLQEVVEGQQQIVRYLQAQAKAQPQQILRTVTGARKAGALK